MPTTLPDDGTLRELDSARGGDVRGFTVVGDSRQLGFCNVAYPVRTPHTVYTKKKVVRPSLSLGMGWCIVNKLYKYRPKYRAESQDGYKGWNC